MLGNTNIFKNKFIAAALLTSALMVQTTNTSFAADTSSQQLPEQTTLHKTVKIDGLDIFYREAGPKDAPVLLLLHGFPTSSRMFSDLIEELSGEYRLIAPDYPGFGNSSMPSVDEFNYTFDNLANIVDGFADQINLTSYTLYVMDYGAPVGFRLATMHPEKVDGLIIQNGNAYDEGLEDFWTPFKAYWQNRTDENAAPLNAFLNIDTTKWQYTHGTRNPEVIDPDNWVVDQYFQDREGNKEIQLELFYDYGSNPPLYPQWQEYFRTHQPATLVVWGKNDYIFPASGAHPYLRDLNNVDFNLLDTGHFALSEDGQLIADKIKNFMENK